MKPDVKKKALSLGAKLLMGKGKTQALYEMLDRALGMPCFYRCGEVITLDNASIDHRVPIGSRKTRGGGEATKEERAKADRAANLRIICRRCNGIKGNLTEFQFIKFMKFCESDPQMGDNLRKRLGASKMIFHKGK